MSCCRAYSGPAFSFDSLAFLPNFNLPRAYVSKSLQDGRMLFTRFPSWPGGPDGCRLSFFKVRDSSNFFFPPHNKATRRRATLQASLLLNRNCLVSNGSISSTSSNKETCSTLPTIIDGQATTRPLLFPGIRLNGLHLTIASKAINPTPLVT